MGLVPSMVGMIIVFRVNGWDDAPGGGFFVLFAMMVGIAAGLAGGLTLSGSIWRNRSQIQVWRTAKRSMLRVCASSIVPLVVIMPWTGPDLPSRRALSISVATAFGAISALLFMLSASYLGNGREGVEELDSRGS